MSRSRAHISRARKVYKIQSLGLSLPEGQERSLVIAHVCDRTLELVRIRRACGNDRAALAMASAHAMGVGLLKASAQVQAAAMTQQ